MKNYREKLKNIILIINTASSEKVTIGLRIDDQKYKIERKLDQRKAQAVLPMIDVILGKHKMSLLDVQGIYVNTGPGSFTGLRVGISVANALSFALKIPVNKKKAGEFVQALYE